MGRRGAALRDAGDLPLTRTRPRRVRGCDRGEARRPVHDQEQDAGGAAAPKGRLVRALAAIAAGGILRFGGMRLGNEDKRAAAGRDKCYAYTFRRRHLMI
jgi:hypothetical protein